MTPGQPSYATIAERAGVAKSTAIRVVRALRRGKKVESPQAERVRAAIAELIEYSGQAAPAIRPAIALVGRDVMPFGLGVYLDLPSLLTAELDRFGFDVLPVVLSDGLAQWRREGRDRQAAGLLLLNYLEAEFEGFLPPRMLLPLCLFNTCLDLPVDQVHPDDGDGMLQGMEHLIALGHQRILWIEPRLPGTRSSLEARRSVIRSSCTRASVHLEEAADLDAAMARLDRSDRATAIVTYSEREVPPLLNRLYERRLRIPDDLSLLTAGHAEAMSWMTPPITTVEVPIAAMVRHAVALIIGRIRGNRPPGIEKIVVPERLIVRQSTGPPPSGSRGRSR